MFMQLGGEAALGWGRELDVEVEREWLMRWELMERERRRQCQQAIDSMLHVPLRDAVDILRAYRRRPNGSGDEEEAKVLGALTAVQRFSYSNAAEARQLLLFSGAIAPVVALACGDADVSSAAVTNAALRVLGSFVSSHDDVCDDDVCKVAVSAGAAAVPALLRGGGPKTDVGLTMLAVAASSCHYEYNAMLAAGVGPVLIDLSTANISAEVRRRAESLLVNRQNLSFDPPTPLQASAVLPELLRRARQATGPLQDVLGLLCTLIRGGTPAHVQAALDAGAVGVVVDALRSNKDSVVAAACKVLSSLASGSAAQLGVLLDAGAVSALCAAQTTLRGLDGDALSVLYAARMTLRGPAASFVFAMHALPKNLGELGAAACSIAMKGKWDAALNAMRQFGDPGCGATHEKDARLSVVRDRLFPEILAVHPPRNTGRDAYSAAQWLVDLTRVDDMTLKVLRESSAIQDVIGLTAAFCGTSLRAASTAIEALLQLCANDKPALVEATHAVLPALARMYESINATERAETMRLASRLMEAVTDADISPQLDERRSWAAVQAALDTDFYMTVMDALRSNEDDVVEAVCTVLSFLASGSALHLTALLDADALVHLCFAGSMNGMYVRTAATAACFRLLAATVPARAGEADGAQRAALLESHALPQLLEAVESPDCCVGAARVLRGVFRPPDAQWHGKLFRPCTLDALARVAGSADYEETARAEVAALLRMFCAGPPVPSKPLARHAASLLLPLCKCEVVSVQRDAREGLSALKEIVPEAGEDAHAAHEVMCSPATPGAHTPTR